MEHNFNIGDYVIITNSRSGTALEDIGLFCRIVSTTAIPRTFNSYTIEIDRDKKGNNDRFLAPCVLRLATQEEISDNTEIINYEIY